MDFARLPAPHFEALRINDIIRATVKSFEPQFCAIGRPPITPELFLDDETSPVRGDPVRLQKAIESLLYRALVDMPAGGTLTIRTKQRGDMVHLVVSDTGRGFEIAQPERLFSIHPAAAIGRVAGHGAGTGQLVGEGLILATVQAIVSDHNGRIAVESAPGAGTTFLLDLPALSAPPSRPTARVKKTPPKVQPQQPEVTTDATPDTMIEPTLEPTPEQIPEITLESTPEVGAEAPVEVQAEIKAEDVLQSPEPRYVEEIVDSPGEAFVEAPFEASVEAPVEIASEPEAQIVLEAPEEPPVDAYEISAEEIPVEMEGNVIAEAEALLEASSHSQPEADRDTQPGAQPDTQPVLLSEEQSEEQTSLAVNTPKEVLKAAVEEAPEALEDMSEKAAEEVPEKTEEREWRSPLTYR